MLPTKYENSIDAKMFVVVSVESYF